MIHCYRRVSTSRQDLGLDAQQAAINRWPMMSTSTDVADYVDDGVSGSVPLAERPAASNMLKVAATGDVVVVAKLDRLFRSVADAATTIEGWLARGITLVALAEGFDMGSPYGRAMAQMASVFAELERAMIRERTKAALQAKKARGDVLGREAPYGFQLVDSRLVIDINEQVILKMMGQFREAGMRSRRIAAALDKRGIKPRHGNKWNPGSVWKILRQLAKTP